MNLLAAFRSWFTGGDVTVALTRYGVPVTAPMPVGKWRNETDGRNEVMRATVAFGPFVAETEFDGAVIARGDMTETVRFPSMGKVWEGDMFTYTPEIIFTRDTP